MKKTGNKQSTVIPLGYTGSAKGFNLWQRHMQRELDRILKTSVASKYHIA